MRIPSGKFGVVLAVAILALGVMTWIRLLPTKGRVSEDSLRDTTGIEMEVGDMEASPGGVRVAVQLHNRTERAAASVVFTVEVVDGAGRTLLVNPLGNSLNLRPGESRAVDVPIPVPPATDSAADNFARGRVNLVRWAD